MSNQPDQIEATAIEAGDEIKVTGIGGTVLVDAVGPDGPGNIRVGTGRGGSIFLRGTEKVVLVGRLNNVQLALEL